MLAGEGYEGEVKWRLTKWVEGRNWWLEGTDNDCECDVSEGVMSGDDGGGGEGAEGEEASVSGMGDMG